MPSPRLMKCSFQESGSASTRPRFSLRQRPVSGSCNDIWMNPYLNPAGMGSSMRLIDDWPASTFRLLFSRDPGDLRGCASPTRNSTRRWSVEKLVAMTFCWTTVLPFFRTICPLPECRTDQANASSDSGRSNTAWPIALRGIQNLGSSTAGWHNERRSLLSPPCPNTRATMN